MAGRVLPRQSEVIVNMLPKIMLTVVVEDDKVDSTVELYFAIPPVPARWATVRFRLAHRAGGPHSYWRKRRKGRYRVAPEPRS